MAAEDDKAAASFGCSCGSATNGRVVQFDVAEFYTLRDGRIANPRVLDSFDLVQQLLGQDLTDTSPPRRHDQAHRMEIARSRMNLGLRRAAGWGWARKPLECLTNLQRRRGTFALQKYRLRFGQIRLFEASN